MRQTISMPGPKFSNKNINLIEWSEIIFMKYALSVSIVGNIVCLNVAISSVFKLIWFDYAFFFCILFYF